MEYCARRNMSPNCLLWPATFSEGLAQPPLAAGRPLSLEEENMALAQPPLIAGRHTSPKEGTMALVQPQSIRIVSISQGHGNSRNPPLVA